MYGSMEMMQDNNNNNADNDARGGDYRELNEEESGGAGGADNFRPKDRREEFAKRRQRQSTKKFLKKVQSERAVFDTLFEPDADNLLSSKKVRRRKKSRAELPGLFTTSPSAGGGLGGSAASRSSQPATRAAGLPETNNHNTKHHRHSFLYQMLSPHSKAWHATAFKHFISTVIMVDLVLFILSTDETFTVLSDEFYHAAEGIASTIFLLEYVARVYTVGEKKKYREMGPIQVCCVI